MASLSMLLSLVTEGPCPELRSLVCLDYSNVCAQNVLDFYRTSFPPMWSFYFKLIVCPQCSEHLKHVIPWKPYHFIFRH